MQIFEVKGGKGFNSTSRPGKPDPFDWKRLHLRDFFLWQLQERKRELRQLEEKTNPFSFTEDHYKQLGRALVVAMYRTFVEVYKEEKTLKESVYLRSINKEISDIKQQLKNELY